ncbi:hypothetical protein [Pectobacterium polaris]|nr:hypothetical protein [Pectobacterium polaris]
MKFSIRALLCTAVMVVASLTTISAFAETQKIRIGVIGSGSLGALSAVHG